MRAIYFLLLYGCVFSTGLNVYLAIDDSNEYGNLLNAYSAGFSSAGLMSFIINRKIFKK